MIMMAYGVDELVDACLTYVQKEAQAGNNPFGMARMISSMKTISPVNVQLLREMKTLLQTRYSDMAKRHGHRTFGSARETMGDDGLTFP